MASGGQTEVVSGREMWEPAFITVWKETTQGMRRGQGEWEGKGTCTLSEGTNGDPGTEE